MTSVSVAIPPGSFIGFPFEEPALMLEIFKKQKPDLFEFHLDLLEYFEKKDDGNIVRKVKNVYGKKNWEVYYNYYLGRIFYSQNIDYLLNLAAENDFIESSIQKYIRSKCQFIIFTFQFLRVNLISISWISLYAKRLKKIKDVKIGLIGTGLGTISDEDIIYISNNFPEIDFLVRGNPGEFLINIINDYDNQKRKNTPGIYFFSNITMTKKQANNHIFYHQNTSYNYDWSKYSMDAYLNMRIGTRVCTVASSFGCTHNCTFCDEKIKIGSYRPRPVENVLNEIQELKEKYDIKFIRFSDSLLNADNDRLAQIAVGLKKLGVYWFGMMRMDKALNEDLIKTLYEGGCRGLWFGLESAAIDTQKKFKKFSIPEMGLDTFKLMKKIGIKSTLLLMSDIPFETQFQINETFQYLKKCRKLVDFIHIERFMLMQGTNIQKNFISYSIKGYKKKTLSDYLDYEADTKYDTVLRELWLKLKNVESISLPVYEDHYFVTSI